MEEQSLYERPVHINKEDERKQLKLKIAMKSLLANKENEILIEWILVQCNLFTFRSGSIRSLDLAADHGLKGLATNLISLIVMARPDLKDKYVKLGFNIGD